MEAATRQLGDVLEEIDHLNRKATIYFKDGPVDDSTESFVLAEGEAPPPASNTSWRSTSPRKRLKFGVNGVVANGPPGLSAALPWLTTHRMMRIFLRNRQREPAVRASPPNSSQG